MAEDKEGQGECPREIAGGSVWLRLRKRRREKPKVRTKRRGRQDEKSTSSSWGTEFYPECKEADAWSEAQLGKGILAILLGWIVGQEWKQEDRFKSMFSIQVQDTVAWPRKMQRGWEIGQMQGGLSKYHGQCLVTVWLWKWGVGQSQEWLPESWFGWLESLRKGT